MHQQPDSVLVSVLLSPEPQQLYKYVLVRFNFQNSIVQSYSVLPSVFYIAFFRSFPRFPSKTWEKKCQLNVFLQCYN